jgi:hypothetical protein
VIRTWYDNLLGLLMSNFKDFISQCGLINVSTFIVLLVSIIILYCLVWKSFEENLKDLLKTSVDLTNLIPDNIKDKMVKLINEEEEKKE